MLLLSQWWKPPSCWPPPPWGLQPPPTASAPRAPKPPLLQARLWKCTPATTRLHSSSTAPPRRAGPATRTQLVQRGHSAWTLPSTSQKLRFSWLPASPARPASNLITSELPTTPSYFRPSIPSPHRATLCASPFLAKSWCWPHVIRRLLHRPSMVTSSWRKVGGHGQVRSVMIGVPTGSSDAWRVFSKSDGVFFKMSAAAKC